jgi:hypothetical protein
MHDQDDMCWEYDFVWELRRERRREFWKKREKKVRWIDEMRLRGDKFGGFLFLHNTNILIWWNSKIVLMKDFKGFI